MGVTKKPIYAREALLPMSFPREDFRKDYVPFVRPTDAAPNDPESKRVGPIDLSICRQAEWLVLDPPEPVVPRFVQRALKSSHSGRNEKQPF